MSNTLNVVPTRVDESTSPIDTKSGEDTRKFGQAVVRTLRSLDEINSVKDVWEQWQDHPNADRDFFSTIVQLKPEIERPHTLLLSRKGCPEALLVGRLENALVECRIGYKSLFKTSARQLIFNYGGQFGDLSESNSELLVHEVIWALRRGEADLAMFSFLRVDSALFHAVITQPGMFSRDLVIAPQPHRGMTIPGSQHEFHAAVSPKIRNSHRFKKLQKDFNGKFRVRCFSQPHEVDDLFRDVEMVAHTTYQRGLGVGFMNNEEFRRRLELHAEKGWLRCYVLYLSDKPAAFWLCTLYHETLHSDSMGYDPAYGKYSPGRFLVTQIIKQLSIDTGTDRVKQIDWGLGDAEYKEALSDCQWQECCVYLFAPTLAGLRLNAIRTPAIMIDKSLKKVLKETKCINSVKKWWRSRLAKEAQDVQVEDAAQSIHN